MIQRRLGLSHGTINAMRTTMDSAGRLVIPKDIRQQAQLKPAMPLDVRVREGRIEIEPAPLEIKLERRGRLVVAVPAGAVPPLMSEIVEETRRRLGHKRAGE
jgi:AbrB family looped-hinge helix DNA binding protein